LKFLKEKQINKFYKIYESDEYEEEIWNEKNYIIVNLN
jgi:hypothetical protein